MWKFDISWRWLIGLQLYDITVGFHSVSLMCQISFFMSSFFSICMLRWLEVAEMLIYQINLNESLNAAVRLSCDLFSIRILSYAKVVSNRTTNYVFYLQYQLIWQLNFYSVLVDPHKRAIYDTTGTKGLETEGWQVRDLNYHCFNNDFGLLESETI